MQRGVCEGKACELVVQIISVLASCWYVGIRNISPDLSTLLDDEVSVILGLIYGKELQTNKCTRTISNQAGAHGTVTMAAIRAGSKLSGSAGKLEFFAGIDLPHFLCPALLPTAQSLTRFKGPSRALRTPSQRFQTRYLSIQSRVTAVQDYSSIENHVSELPQRCGGCGSFSQTSDVTAPGFYTLTRRSVEAYLQEEPRRLVRSKYVDAQALEAAQGQVDGTALDSLTTQAAAPTSNMACPVCDRCHNLKHHHSGRSIEHPSIQSIQNTILESPHKYNHIYHVIDAADFPMSLIPGLYRPLHLTPQRSMNRRSKTGRFYHGKKTEISFIITRSDLLAPVKAQVDSLMPRLVEILRDALGSFGKDVRLGNVRCVSARRDWWTKDLKEEIWERGGGGWMVGKVNVGKSRLFASVFPKGRRDTAKQDPSFSTSTLKPTMDAALAKVDSAVRATELLDTLSLLPPALEEVDYPTMPLVHPLPGTTASPIRVPFGGGKGELVDLPGLTRGDLELHVQEPHRLSLVMRSRVVPEQHVIKPGQSLLLGGFIRITPGSPECTILGYAFTPISAHLTSTEKAIAVQTQALETGVENISLPGTGEKIQSAGKFQLKWDVTKQRSGPITAPDAAGITTDKLPYCILSTDILVEGCGWVELVCQVRKRQLEPSGALYGYGKGCSNGFEQTLDNINWPVVEVFSPEGKFIASRRPINAWLYGGPKKSGSNVKGRPRKSMKGAKKKMKALRREIFRQ
jgi:genetic interactor of prohibitins 3, mitochondrial